MQGSERLRAFLDGNEERIADFARRLAVSRQAVHAWLRGTTPDPARFVAIEDATQGAVPARCWFDPSYGER